MGHPPFLDRDHLRSGCDPNVTFRERSGTLVHVPTPTKLEHPVGLPSSAAAPEPFAQPSGRGGGTTFGPPLEGDLGVKQPGARAGRPDTSSPNPTAHLAGIGRGYLCVVTQRHCASLDRVGPQQPRRGCSSGCLQQRRHRRPSGRRLCCCIPLDSDRGRARPHGRAAAQSLGPLRCDGRLCPERYRIKEVEFTRHASACRVPRLLYVPLTP